MDETTNREFVVRAANIYHQLAKPLTKEKLEEGYHLGMIKKENLKDDTWYIGFCRNAKAARWANRLQRFVYMRLKFGAIFSENIPHPEDDFGFDIFVPIKEVTK